MTSAHAAPPRRYTYVDLAALPDGQRGEIIDGELVVNASPVPQHQRVAFRLARALDQALGDRGLGAVYVAPMSVRRWSASTTSPASRSTSRRCSPEGAGTSPGTALQRTGEVAATTVRAAPMVQSPRRAAGQRPRASSWHSVYA